MFLNNEKYQNSLKLIFILTISSFLLFSCVSRDGESFEYGTPEATKNSLNMTPGQSTDDWNKQVGVMQQRQSYMRETLAKMWEVEEGHNPFVKNIDERKTRFMKPGKERDDFFKKAKAAGQAKAQKEIDKMNKSKKEDKTMTGKPMTKVAVGSEKDD